jgi:hypothetical protein
VISTDGERQSEQAGAGEHSGHSTWRQTQSAEGATQPKVGARLYRAFGALANFPPGLLGYFGELVVALGSVAFGALGNVLSGALANCGIITTQCQQNPWQAEGSRPTATISRESTGSLTIFAGIWIAR